MIGAESHPQEGRVGLSHPHPPGCWSGLFGPPAQGGWGGLFCPHPPGFWEGLLHPHPPGFWEGLLHPHPPGFWEGLLHPHPPGFWEGLLHPHPPGVCVGLFCSQPPRFVMRRPWPPQPVGLKAPDIPVRPKGYRPRSGFCRERVRQGMQSKPREHGVSRPCRLYGCFIISVTVASCSLSISRAVEASFHGVIGYWRVVADGASAASVERAGCTGSDL